MEVELKIDEEFEDECAPSKEESEDLLSAR
jgi:hypothetical protein